MIAVQNDYWSFKPATSMSVSEVLYERIYYTRSRRRWEHFPPRLIRLSSTEPEENTSNIHRIVRLSVGLSFGFSRLIVAAFEESSSSKTEIAEIRPSEGSNATLKTKA